MKCGKKIFKILSRSDDSRFNIRFRLNASIHHHGGDISPFILCAKSYPFNTWQVGGYLEIDLDRVHSNIIGDTNIVRVLDENVADEIRKSQIELYELKNAKEKLIPMLNNFSQKIISEDFFLFSFDEFLFNEFAPPVWKERLDNMTNEFDKLKRKNEDLQRGKNDLANRFNDINAKYEEIKDMHENTRNQREGERVNNARTNTRLEERLESANAKVVDLTRRLTDSENQVARLEMRSDEKNVRIQNLNNQLADLRVESSEKDGELERKDEEIKRLKNLAKSHDKRAEKSQEDLSKEKLRSEKGNLELLVNELKISLEQIHSLSKYHERLIVAQKSHNQANIDIHEENISGVKQELTKQRISVVHIQEICRKCERVAELHWELEQIKKQTSTNNNNNNDSKKDWKSINANFTPELVQEWKEYSFTYEQCQDWININSPTRQNIAIKEPAYYAWLRDMKKMEPEEVLNYGDSQELNREFLEWYQQQFEARQEVPPYNNKN